MADTTPEHLQDNQDIIDALIDAYFAEIETVMNYIANAQTLDGVRAKHIKDSLQADVDEELGHAQAVAARIKTIGGTIPGSAQFKPAQHSLQPPSDTLDVISVVKGVIDAEESAIAGYKRIIDLAGGRDHPTEDLAIAHMADEEEHRRQFVGYLKELEAGAR
jgi:bacterioferritin